MCGTWLCLMCESYNVVRLNGHSFPEFLHVNMCAFEFSFLLPANIMHF